MLAACDLSEAAEHLSRIAQDVFAMTAGVQLEPCEFALDEQCYTAVLIFRSPICAALLLECEPKAAAVITRRMFALEKSPVGFNDDVRDCLGELANMIGGGLRNFFPELEALDTTPSVFVGSGPASSTDIEGKSVTFDAGSGCVRVSLR